MSDTATEPEAALDSQETWESTTGGTTYVSVKDPRNPRGWIRRKIGGKAARKLNLTVEERLFNQEQIAYGSEHQDPFTNGLLVRIHPKSAERSIFEVTDEELVQHLTGGQDEDFEQLVASTTSEVILRRMLFLAERNATMYRFKHLEEQVAARFGVGKTSRVYQEWAEDQRRNAGADF